MEKLHTLNTKIKNCTNKCSINECLNEFVHVIESAATGMFKPNKDSSKSESSFSEKNDSPWFNDECQEKRYNFLTWLDKYRETQNDETRINMVKARSEYKSTLRKCKYEHDKTKTQKLVHAKYKNAKLYWNMLKESSGIKPANVPLSSFEEYFKAVNNPADPFFTPDEDVIHFNERYEKHEFRLMFEELNLEFLEGDIERSIKQLKANKSGGPDKLINEFFIHGNQILQSTICNLFNKIFDLGYFPEEWSEGYIIPLHKKGSINDVGNYRGITLLSALGKLFTRVLNNRLSDWAENYYVLIEAQAGFRPGMSTTDNIFVLHGLITHILNQGKKLYCTFVDFTKAFDYIVRDNLWYKLIKYGLRGKILDIIKSMYASVKSRVKFCNNLGNEFMCSLGVRQGECLSPLLFSLFLNDIEDEFLKSGMEGLNVNMFKVFLLLYADDIIIFANTAEEMQNSLNLLSSYCERWKLKVNVNKTKVMVFRKGGILPGNLDFYYDGETLEIVSRFKYLGVVFTTGGSFSDAQNTLAGQAQKAIFTLSKYLQKFTFIPPKHKLDLFDKMILPILNYGSEVWGFGQANSIERIQLQFCKKLLGVKKNTQNDFIYGELGRTSCQIKRFVRIINYWFKLLDSHETKYVKIVYNLMLQDLERFPNKVNWASLLCDLLRSLGFYEVWLHQGVGNQSAFVSLFKQRVTDNFIQNWHSRLENSSRANFYKNIAIFQFQPYLENINVMKFSHAFSKLRVSSHRLAIETGRWVRPIPIPVGERKCFTCQTLEDEYHFVLECPIYSQIRQQYIARYYWTRPSMLKFIELINNTSIKCCRKLCVYIHKAFELRSEILYRNNS